MMASEIRPSTDGLRGRRSLSLAVGTVLLILQAFAGPAAAADGNRAKHEATVAYWTPARIAAATPRDFVYERGRFQPAAKPGTGGGGSTSSTGSHWPDGKGLVYRATGRVLFTLDGTDYICSGAVATDGITGRSIVLTAAHCAYDGAAGGFASRWLFFPEFDTSPTYNCALAPKGCWTASALVVHGGFAYEPGFTSNATLHDWAFAVIDDNVNGGSLETTVRGSFPIAFRDYPQGTKMHATGYPAGGKYSPGHELIYCSGGVGFDTWNANRTYKLKCDMTGGSSGGPWLTGFDGTGDTGTLSSVNSYTYSGMTAMHGPKFNAKTQATWTVALDAVGNAIVQ